MVPARAGWCGCFADSPGRLAMVPIWPSPPGGTWPLRLSVWISAPPVREYLWSHRPAVFVFNHQSAADALIMGYLLRQDFTGIAKIEASRNLLTGPFLRSVGVVFIDRFKRRARH